MGKWVHYDYDTDDNTKEENEKIVCSDSDEFLSEIVGFVSKRQSSHFAPYIYRGHASDLSGLAVFPDKHENGTLRVPYDAGDYAYEGRAHELRRAIFPVWRFFPINMKTAHCVCPTVMGDYAGWRRAHAMRRAIFPAPHAPRVACHQYSTEIKGGDNYPHSLF